MLRPTGKMEHRSSFPTSRHLTKNKSSARELVFFDGSPRLQVRVYVLQRQIECFRDATVDNITLDHIQSKAQIFMVAACLLPALLRKLDRIRKCRIRQCKC